MQNRDLWSVGRYARVSLTQAQIEALQQAILDDHRKLEEIRQQRRSAEEDVTRRYYSKNVIFYDTVVSYKMGIICDKTMTLMETASKSVQ